MVAQDAAARRAHQVSAAGDAESVSAELEGWLAQDGPRTLGSLNELFGQKSFAIAFVLLLGVPALPLPTGGATHVFEIVAALLALTAHRRSRRDLASRSVGVGSISADLASSASCAG